MQNTYLIIFALSIMSGFTTLIGTVLVLFCKNNVKAVVSGIGFSTGIMLLISFFELIPEALENTTKIAVLLAGLAGLLVLGFLNYVIPHTHLVKERRGSKANLYKVALLVTFGLILHDLPEGFAMVNSYIINPASGILVAIAIALHNIPEEFAVAAPIAALEDKKFLYKAAVFSAIAEPAGAMIGLVGIAVLPALSPIFLAFAAGAMIFVSIHELIPFAQKYKKPAFFVMGIIVSIAVFIVLNYLFV
jgi:zinc transporter, ZIP family